MFVQSTGNHLVCELSLWGTRAADRCSAVRPLSRYPEPLTQATASRRPVTGTDTAGTQLLRRPTTGTSTSPQWGCLASLPGDTSASPLSCDSLSSASQLHSLAGFDFHDHRPGPSSSVDELEATISQGLLQSVAGGNPGMRLVCEPEAVRASMSSEAELSVADW